MENNIPKLFFLDAPGGTVGGWLHILLRFYSILNIVHFIKRDNRYVELPIGICVLLGIYSRFNRKNISSQSIIRKLQTENKIVYSVASSGIAATLLLNGKTVHSGFKVKLL